MTCVELVVLAALAAALYAAAGVVTVILIAVRLETAKLDIESVLEIIVLWPAIIYYWRMG